VEADRNAVCRPPAQEGRDGGSLKIGVVSRKECGWKPKGVRRAAKRLAWKLKGTRCGSRKECGLRRLDRSGCKKLQEWDEGGTKWHGGPEIASGSGVDATGKEFGLRAAWTLRGRNPDRGRKEADFERKEAALRRRLERRQNTGGRRRHYRGARNRGRGLRGKNP
jgi:hypothetical protein